MNLGFFFEGCFAELVAVFMFRDVHQSNYHHVYLKWLIVLFVCIFCQVSEKQNWG